MNARKCDYCGKFETVDRIRGWRTITQSNESLDYCSGVCIAMHFKGHLPEEGVTK